MYVFIYLNYNVFSVVVTYIHRVPKKEATFIFLIAPWDIGRFW